MGTCQKDRKGEFMKGIIEGKIITEDGSPMPGLTVTALGPGGSVEEKTDAGGNYRLVVVPGTIKVTVATTHFYLPVHESVALAANETLVLDFVLVPRNERQ